MRFIILILLVSCLNKDSGNYLKNSFNSRPEGVEPDGPGNSKPGTGGGNGGVDLAGKTFFVANSQNTFKLMKTNGVQVETLTSLPPGTNVNGIIEFQNRTYLALEDLDDGSTGELYILNDQEDSLQKVSSIGGSKSSNPNDLIVFNNKLYFSASNNNGRELWSYDGANFNLVKDIEPGVNPSNPHQFVVLDNELLFTASTQTEGYELWKMDRQENVTQVPSASSGSKSLEVRYPVVFQNKLYFVGNSYSSAALNRLALMSYSKNSGILDEVRFSHYMRFLTPFNNKLYFGCNGLSLRSGICTWSPGSASFERVLDINSSYGARFSYGKVFNNKLYFSAYGPGIGYELHVIDSNNQVSVVKDINIGLQGAFPSSLKVIKDYLLFSANDDVNGFELWRVDKANNSNIVENINGQQASSHPILDFSFYAL
jgi:ELWxxDGT repeat protein